MQQRLLLLATPLRTLVSILPPLRPPNPTESFPPSPTQQRAKDYDDDSATARRPHTCPIPYNTTHLSHSQSAVVLHVQGLLLLLSHCTVPALQQLLLYGPYQ